MKLKSSKQVWGARLIGWIIALVVSCGGMFGGGALCGIGIAIPILLVPLFLFRKKKQG